MVEEPRRTIAYLCPHCRNAVVAEKTIFSIAAGPGSVPCPCGKSALQIDMLGDHVKLTVPCLFCEKEHSVTCSTHAFLHEKALAFSCAASGLDCCYVGGKGPVFAALERLEAAVDKLEAAAGADGTFLDDVVMEEVLSELKDIARRSGISCTCGSGQWRLKVNFSSVDILCAQCGCALRIPAATADDLEDICCKQKLLIHGWED